VAYSILPRIRFLLFCLRRGWPFRTTFGLKLYGLNFRVFIRDVRAFLLSKEDGVGLQHKLIERSLEKLVEERALFLDLGSNYGEWSAAFASRCDAIVAVEPNPELARLLQHNFSTLPSVKVIQVALSDRVDEAPLFLRSSYSGGSSLYGGHIHRLNRLLWWGIGSRKATKVRTQPLLDLYEQNCADWDKQSRLVIKVDIEGAETLILEDLKEILGRHEDWLLVIEFNPDAIRAVGGSPQLMWKVLNSLGSIEVFTSGAGSVQLDEDGQMARAVIEGPDFSCDAIITPMACQGNPN